MRRDLHPGLAAVLVWGWLIAAAGAMAAGDLESGPVPDPRFTDNRDGTVTDHRTGLVWLRDASCAGLPKTDDSGRAYGTTAVAAAKALAAPVCGLSDASRAGDWRLPSRFELETLLDLELDDPALPNAAGTAKWVDADPFTGVESTYYWSSSMLASDPLFVWCVDLSDGVVFYAYEVNYYYVWPVRGGTGKAK